MADQAMKVYTIEELKALGLIQTGAKNDPSSTTPSAQALYGPFPGSTTQFGPFADSSVRPGMYSATARARTFASVIPLYPTDVYNEMIEIETGVTEGSGNNTTSSCGDAPKPGDLKVMRQSFLFGVINIQTRVFDLTQAGMRKNRATVDRELFNSAAAVNPWLPSVQGMDDSDRASTELRAALFALGIELERNAGQVHFAGSQGTESNTYRGVARQWAGLDSQIKTGYTDSVTGLAAPAADSVVESFNAVVTGNDASGRNIVEAVTDAQFAVQDRALQVSAVEPEWAYVMRGDLFRALAAEWANAYTTFRADGATNQPINRDGFAMQQFRLDIQNGRYLLVDGVRRPVIIDDSIARETLGNNFYKSDIYGVALNWGGRPLVYTEYFDMNNSDAQELANVIGGADDSTVINNGMYRVFKKNQGGCYQYQFFARPRLILDAPFVHFRVDDIFYNNYAKTRDPRPGMSLYQDGGVSYR